MDLARARVSLACSPVPVVDITVETSPSLTRLTFLSRSSSPFPVETAESSKQLSPIRSRRGLLLSPSRQRALNAAPCLNINEGCRESISIYLPRHSHAYTLKQCAYNSWWVAVRRYFFGVWLHIPCINIICRYKGNERGNCGSMCKVWSKNPSVTISMRLLYVLLFPSIQLHSSLCYRAGSISSEECVENCT